ncbi:MAG: hypothetical protein HYZ29_34335 [Myxococcales bacterium]|nr:hypothetical protein [Myxococcales bacterium]
MTTHQDHHFSITVGTQDLAVLHCLRALADFAQETGNKRIVWGGTKAPDWRRGGGNVKFRFSRPQYRERFLAEAQRLLPSTAWMFIGQDDEDPAFRQS